MQTKIRSVASISPLLLMTSAVITAQQTIPKAVTVNHNFAQFNKLSLKPWLFDSSLITFALKACFISDENLQESTRTLLKALVSMWYVPFVSFPVKMHSLTSLVPCELIKSKEEVFEFFSISNLQWEIEIKKYFLILQRWLSYRELHHRKSYYLLLSLHCFFWKCIHRKWHHYIQTSNKRTLHHQKQQSKTWLWPFWNLRSLVHSLVCCIWRLHHLLCCLSCTLHMLFQRMLRRC